jgi:hypothetical protein
MRDLEVFSRTHVKKYYVMQGYCEWTVPGMFQSCNLPYSIYIIRAIPSLVSNDIHSSALCQHLYSQTKRKQDEMQASIYEINK